MEHAGKVLKLVNLAVIYRFMVEIFSIICLIFTLELQWCSRRFSFSYRFCQQKFVNKEGTAIRKFGNTRIVTLSIICASFCGSLYLIFYSVGNIGSKTDETYPLEIGMLVKDTRLK